MDLVDDILPKLDGPKVLIQKGQVDRLGVRVSNVN
jgi:hypothetical protein